MPKTKSNRINFIFQRFNSLEIVTFVYALLSGIYILCFAHRIEEPIRLLLNRVGIVLGLVFLSSWNSRHKALVVEFARVSFPLLLIAYWYPETYSLNHGVLLPVLDPFFDMLDLRLFDCRPAMEFSRAVPYAWFAEMMYFAYSSFFLIYIYIGCSLFFTYREAFYPVAFVILTSFLIFYTIFIFIPVEGPQFYWSYPDNRVPDGYLFSTLMRFIQSMGEKPTGAFPSSHVGMTLIYLWVLFTLRRKTFWVVLPVACLLFCSTVYIKAHYLVDVAAAFVVTPVVYWASLKLYGVLSRRFPQMDGPDRIRLEYERKKKN